jgi:predicted neuraminidase
MRRSPFPDWVSTILLSIAGVGTWILSPTAYAQRDAVLLEQFIYTSAPFPECHASTLCETPGGLIAAWFGGTQEGHTDVGIWVALHRDGKWTEPGKVAEGLEGDTRYPCWNPVLFQPPGGSLLLFYKVGPSPSRWWGMVMSSPDDGVTWSPPWRIDDPMLGPIRNKPILLTNGRLLCGSSLESSGWEVFMETCSAQGTDWKRQGPLNDRDQFGAIQPTILRHSDQKLQILSRSRQGVITTNWSDDEGASWSAMERTSLPNPNSGIDAVTLRDGRHLLVYNHSTRRGPFPSGREVLNVATSRDGRSWLANVVLERQEGEYSYPAVIQTHDGKVHVTYTYRRQRIKHVILDPEKLSGTAIENGEWPAEANGS